MPASGGGLCELGGGELGGGELEVTPTSMTTRTLMPPGFTVSWQPTQTAAAFPETAATAAPATPGLALTVTVAHCPASGRRTH